LTGAGRKSNFGAQLGSANSIAAAAYAAVAMAVTEMTDPPSQSRKRSLIARASRQLWRLTADRRRRSVMWLLWRLPAGAFQPFNDTGPDRYPRIFRFVQDTLGAQNELSILSFGCSTGEEVFALRRYFPKAAIKGVDINRGNIAAARARLACSPDASLIFDVANSTANEGDGVYDAIFAMAVLRHGSLGSPGVTRCDHLIRFADFAAAIEDFSRCLKPGGLLIIRHSNFRLCDAPAGAGFETILSVPIRGKKRTPLFGPDNSLLPDREYPDTVFRKRVSP
jgi:SAM-dependent methyltransferase